MTAVAMTIATAKTLKKNKQISNLFLVLFCLPDHCIQCKSYARNFPGNFGKCRVLRPNGSTDSTFLPKWSFNERILDISHHGDAAVAVFGR